jgi:hypothetical protein
MLHFASNKPVHFVQVDQKVTGELVSVPQDTPQVLLRDLSAVNGVEIDRLEATTHAFLGKGEYSLVAVPNIEVLAGRADTARTKCFIVPIRAHKTLHKGLYSSRLACARIATNEYVSAVPVQPDLVSEMGFQLRTANDLV